MAFSTQRAVSDGTLQDLGVSIEYIDRDDIHVTIEAVPKVDGVDYTWTNDALIHFTDVVPDGEEVLLRRQTQLSTMLNKFASGATFNNATMDENFEQVLFIGQEASEGASLADIFNDVDMHKFKLKNLSPASGPGEAVTYDQLGDDPSAALLRIELADNLNPAKGAALVGYAGRNVADVLSEVVRLEDYLPLAVDPTQAMLMAAAVAQGKTLLLPSDVKHGGPLVFYDTIPLLHPTHVRGAGAGLTTVIFQDMLGYSGKDGFSIAEGGAKFLESAITDMTICIRGGNGRTCIATPRGNTVYNLNRPTYRFEHLVFRGDVENVDSNKQGMYDYGWQTYIDVGDSTGTQISNVDCYGQYDWTIDPALQNVTSQFINLSTVQNVGGLLQVRIERFLCLHVPIGIQFGWRVSQPIIRGGQIHRSWIGLNSPNASLGGNNYSVLEALISDLNINSQRNGVVFNTSAFLKFDSVRVSRASGGFDHAAGWTGWVLEGITQLAIYGQCRSSNLGTYVAPHAGHRILNCSQAVLDFLIAENCPEGIYLLNGDRIAVNNAVITNGTTGFRYDGIFSDCVISRPRFSSVTNAHVFEVGVNRAEILILPVDGSRFPGVDGSALGINTTATTTLTPYVDNWVKRYQGNSGTYTHNIDLGSITNNRYETWEFKIATVAGATGGAIVIRRASDSSTIVSLPTNGTVQNFYVKVYWNGSNWILLTANTSLA